MQYLFTEQEYIELKAKQANSEYIEKIKKSANEFIEANGCNSVTDEYCGDCPYADMAHDKLGFPYCIAGRYRHWHK